MSLESCITTGNSVGILVQNPNIVRVSRTMVTQNTTGLDPGGGQIISHGNNSLSGNTTNGAFTSNIGEQ